MRVRKVLVRAVLGLLVCLTVVLIVMLVVFQGASRTVMFFVGLVVSPGVAVLGEVVRRWAFRPEIRAVQLVSTDQIVSKITRLLLKNEGSVSARDVEAHVEEIFDGDDKRENFVPVPLRWTHGQDRPGSPSIRDIHADQSCHLDIADVMRPIYMGQPSVMVLCVPVEAVRRLKNLCWLKAGRTRLGIAIYNASGRTTRVQVSVEWDGTWSKPEVSIVP